MRQTVLNRRPTPATAIALVALFVALSGTAVALPGKNRVDSNDPKRGSVGTRAIANNSVRSSDIRTGNVRSSDVLNDSLTGDDILENTLGKVPSAVSADSARPSGPAGGSLTGTYPNPTLGTDSVRAAQFGNMITVTNVTNVPINGDGSVTATCPAGTQVISGGGQPQFFGVEMTTSVRNGNAWLYQAKNLSGAASNMTAQAYCLQA